MNTLHTFLRTLPTFVLVALFSLALTACGSRVAPMAPDGKVHSSGRY